MMSPSDIDDRITQIKHNLETVKSRISVAAEKSGRDADAVQLIAVTKLLPVEMIQAGIQAGIRSFGENYPEEAAEKILAIKPDSDVTWHMIGHIQSRKTDIVCRHFDMVHSLDRMKIARYLDRYSEENSRIMPVLLEVNISGEESKFGWQAWDETRWFDLVALFKAISEMEHIEIRGLMSMPPYFTDSEVTRPLYKRLRRLQQFLMGELPDTNWQELSIGTSFDYEVAVEEGATMVRIGTSIFGHRPVQ